MASAIETELLQATPVKRKKNDSDQEYLDRLARWVLDDMNEEDWDALSGDAQSWVNTAGESIKAKKDIPNFPDIIEDAEEEEGEEEETAAEAGAKDDDAEEEEEEDEEEEEEEGVAAAAPVKKTKRVVVKKAEEKPVTKKTKSTAKPSKKKSRANGSRGEKTKAIAELLTRKSGCTTADILKATGWPSVSVPAMAKALELKLKKVKEKGEPTRYYGS